MEKPVISMCADKAHYNELMVKYYEHENDKLKKENERAQQEHFRIHAHLMGEVRKSDPLRAALGEVIKHMLPEGTTPGKMLSFGEPWPQVAKAMYPDIT
jgi:hypothetical protein